MYLNHLSLAHFSPVEQGGVSHLSSLPQQVDPLVDELATFKTDGAENNRSVLPEPHWEQVIDFFEEVF